MLTLPSEQCKWVPVEPDENMLKPLDAFMRPDAARELLAQVFAAAPQPPVMPRGLKTEAWLAEFEDGSVELHPAESFQGAPASVSERLSW